jgi:hypothetical protein
MYTVYSPQGAPVISKHKKKQWKSRVSSFKKEFPEICLLGSGKYNRKEGIRCEKFLGAFFDFEILILPVLPVPVAPAWDLISTRGQREHELGSLICDAFFVCQNSTPGVPGTTFEKCCSRLFSKFRFFEHHFKYHFK